MTTFEQDEGVPTLFAIGLIRFFTMLAFFCALLYRQMHLVLLSLLLLVMFYGAKLWCRLSLRKLNCSLSVNRSTAFPGETLLLSAEITNAKLLPVWLRLSIPVGGALTASGEEAVLAAGYSLPWYGRAREEWKLTARRRGCYQVGPATAHGGDLFGLFQQRRNYSEPVELLVYPRPVALNEYVCPRRELFGKPGATGAVTDPVYPVGTRDYRHGSPARYIHWKASARHNRLQEKIFEPSAQQKTMLLIDTSSYSRHGEEEAFELALEVAAAMAVQCEHSGSAYGILANGPLAGKMAGKGEAILPPAGGTRQLAAALEILARLQMEADSELADMLLESDGLVNGSGCILFTHRLDESAAAAEILHHKQAAAVFVVDHPSALPLFKGSRLYLTAQLHGEVAGPWAATSATE